MDTITIELAATAIPAKRRLKFGLKRLALAGLDEVSLGSCEFLRACAGTRIREKGLGKGGARWPFRSVVFSRYTDLIIR